MKCPGQDSRYWKGDAIFEAACPYCKAAIEFFKDDTSRKCPNCGRRVPNPEMDFGCAEYCPYAKQCLGGLPGVMGDMEGKRIYRGIMEELRAELAQHPQWVSRAMKAMDIANDVAKRCAQALGPLLAAVSLLVVERFGEEGLSGRLLARYRSRIEGFEGMAGEVEEIVSAFRSGSSRGEAEVARDILLLVELSEAAARGEISREEALGKAQEGLTHQEAQGVAAKLFG